MPIPRFNEFFAPFLRCLEDGEVHTLQEVRNFCIDTFDLDDEERERRLPSGQLVVYDRIGWARTYLKSAGLVKSPERARFQLTSDGENALRSGKEITLEYLKQFPSFQEFIRGNKEETINGFEQREENVDDQTPLDKIASAIEQQNASLANNLKEEIIKMDPSKFEELVLKLLKKWVLDIQQRIPKKLEMGELMGSSL